MTENNTNPFVAERLAAKAAQEEARLTVPSIGNLSAELPGLVDSLDLNCTKCEKPFRAYRVTLETRTIEPDGLCDGCRPQPPSEQVDRADSWKRICTDENFQDSRWVQYAPRPVKDAFHKCFLTLLGGGAKKTSIYATGPTGTFKTTLCWHVLWHLHMRGWTVKAYTINQLADAVLDSFSTETHGTLIKNLIGGGTRDILFIDDIDKCGMAGKSQAPPSLAKAMYDIIDGRYRAGRPVLITTNARKDLIDEIYGEQHGSVIRRRLEDMCTVIETAKLMPAAAARRWNDQ